jgi:CMP-2-keto-3-deoxyoctulosonic acid synthetase
MPTAVVPADARRLAPGELEQIEKLEQLRVLERGYALAVEIVEQRRWGSIPRTTTSEFVARWRATCRVTMS